MHQGDTYTYTWYVVERAAPGPADGSSIVWMYHSHSHEVQDSYAGLLGAIIITRKVPPSPPHHQLSDVVKCLRIAA